MAFMILLDLHIHIYLQYGMMLLASMPLLSSNTLLYHLTMELVLFLWMARFQQDYTCGILFLGMPWERWGHDVLENTLVSCS